MSNHFAIMPIVTLAEIGDTLVVVARQPLDQRGFLDWNWHLTKEDYTLLVSAMELAGVYLTVRARVGRVGGELVLKAKLTKIGRDVLFNVQPEEVRARLRTHIETRTKKSERDQLLKRLTWGGEKKETAA